MLTLILLVILCGGVGLLAVSMAEGKPATKASRSLRARPVGAPTSDAPSAEDPEPPSRALRDRPGPSRRRQRGDVPASQTAIEGTLGELVRPRPARRLLSLVGIAMIAVVVGVGIAALLGAVVGGAAEIVDNTIG